MASAMSRWSSHTNVSKGERAGSLILGGFLLGYGTARRKRTGAALAIAGAALVRRGVTGYCEIYDALGVSRFEGLRSGVATVGHNRGIKIEKSLTINRSSEELYHFWRDLENLPLFMQHIKSVTSLGNNRSHWIVNAPAGTTVEWDAEIYNEIAPQLIAWRSIGNADINHAGSVHFQHAPGQKGTEVRVVLNYEPPFGKRIGKLVSKILTEEPEQQIEEDLHRFKQMMEAGEIATTEGQPSGRVSMGTREQGRRPEPEPVMQY